MNIYRQNYFYRPKRHEIQWLALLVSLCEWCVRFSSLRDLLFSMSDWQLSTSRHESLTRSNAIIHVHPHSLRSMALQIGSVTLVSHYPISPSFDSIWCLQDTHTSKYSRERSSWSSFYWKWHSPRENSPKLKSPICRFLLIEYFLFFA